MHEQALSLEGAGCDAGTPASAFPLTPFTDVNGTNGTSIAARPATKEGAGGEKLAMVLCCQLVLAEDINF